MAGPSTTATQFTKTRNHPNRAGLLAWSVGVVNIHEVDLRLGAKPPTTLQKACTEKRFEANPAGVPAASIVATATVHTPVLANPLAGPAYLISHGDAACADAIAVRG